MWTNKSKNFCSQFALSVPIIQAPMAGPPSNARLISTVSNIGALGSLGAGYLSTGKLSEEIKQIKNSNGKTFSGKFASGLKNEFISRLNHLEDSVPDYPIQNEVTKKIRARAIELANPEYQSLWAGQGSAKCLDISAAKLINKLVNETNHLLGC